MANEEKSLPFMSNVGRAFRNFSPLEKQVTANTIDNTSQSKISFLQKACFLEEMFPNIPISTVNSVLKECKGNLNAVLEFLSESDKPADSSLEAGSGCGNSPLEISQSDPVSRESLLASGAQGGIISFSGPSVPSVSDLFDANSLLLPSSRSSNKRYRY